LCQGPRGHINICHILGSMANVLLRQLNTSTWSFRRKPESRGYWMPVEDPAFIGDQVRHDGVSRLICRLITHNILCLLKKTQIPFCKLPVSKRESIPLYSKNHNTRKTGLPLLRYLSVLVLRFLYNFRFSSPFMEAYNLLR
jgi:hypothetical protein